MKQVLRIIFTSDVHGYFFPTDYNDRNEKPMGLFHIASKFNKDENTLIIDGGDTLQGSPFTYYCKFKDKPEIISKIMNEVGYDIITIGNHDFNYGYSYFERYLNSLDADCVCQNCFDSQNKVLFPYKIFTMKNGFKVGVVGCITEFVNFWERKENLNGIYIKNVFDSVKQAYMEIKDKVDVSICVYHGGFECDLNSGETLETSGENIGGKICRELGFDILLTGHQHVGIEGKYFYGTYVVQNLFNSLSFQEINIFKEDDEKIINSKMILSKDIEIEDRELPFRDEEDSVQNWLDNVVGYLDKELFPKSHLEMAVNGSELADFINKIQIEFSGADISCTSFANKVIGFPKEVRIRDVLLTYPFPNTLVVLEITGKNLKDALERMAEYFDIKDGNICISERFLKPKIEHYNFDYFLGVEYDISYEKNIGERISNIKVNGNPIENSQIYKICMNSYRASGAGGYDMYKNCKVIEKSKEEIFEIIVSYIEKLKHKKS